MFIENCPYHIRHCDNLDEERNRIPLERIGFHLDEAMRFCSQPDLSGLGPLEQTEWESRMKTCRDAIEFTKQSLKKLAKILESFLFHPTPLPLAFPT
jgi:hypothetical protein